MIPQSTLQHFAQLAAGSKTSGYYLYIKEIPGVTTGTYAGWMILDSFHWGTSGSVHESGSAGGSADKGSGSEFSDITMTKPHDKASVQLMQFTITGKHLEKALLDIVVDGRRMARITMTDVLIASFSTVSNVDSFTLNFAKTDYSAT